MYVHMQFVPCCIHAKLTCSEGLKSGCAISFSFSVLMKLEEQILVMPPLSVGQADDVGTHYLAQSIS